MKVSMPDQELADVLQVARMTLAGVSGWLVRAEGYGGVLGADAWDACQLLGDVERAHPVPARPTVVDRRAPATDLAARRREAAADRAELALAVPA